MQADIYIFRTWAGLLTQKIALDSSSQVFKNLANFHDLIFQSPLIFTFSLLIISMQQVEAYRLAVIISLCSSDCPKLACKWDANKSLKGRNRRWQLSPY